MTIYAPKKHYIRVILRPSGITVRIFTVFLVALSLQHTSAAAQTIKLDEIVGGQATWPRMLQLMLALTIVSVSPGLLMMVTCFPRFIIAFSFLRSGLGLPTTPNNMILIGLAMFMTVFVMEPVLEKAWVDGLKPLSESSMKPEDAARKIAQPFVAFMQSNTRPKDFELFQTLAQERLQKREPVSDDDIRVVIPAFMISELRRGFEIGFLIILPFMVIDLIVATIVMSMGMMMLSPQAFSLPMKVLFFVMVDGWGLVVGSLVRSFK